MRAPTSRVNRRGRVTVIVLAVIFLLFTLFDRVITVWTDWLWFDEVRYRQVFTGVPPTRPARCAAPRPVPAAADAAHRHLDHRVRRTDRVVRGAVRAGPLAAVDAVRQ